MAEAGQPIEKTLALWGWIPDHHPLVSEEVAFQLCIMDMDREDPPFFCPPSPNETAQAKFLQKIDAMAASH